MMDKREKVDWLDLPKELWPLITKHLNTTIDVLRFRSTCNSWRSLLPLPLPLPSPSLFSPQIRIPHANFCLLQTKIYRLEYLSPQHPSPSPSKGWIIKFGESKSIPLRLLDLFTNCSLSLTRPIFQPHIFPKPKVLNLTYFRFVELMEAYTLNHYRNQDGVEMVRMAVANVRKVVLFPSFPVEGRMVFPLYQDGKLGVSKIGDHQNWTIIEEDDDGKARYDDIILHKGQVYVVNKWGTIFWIDCSSFKLVQFSPVLWAFGKRKQLVESGGSLYVVDMFIEGEPDNPRGMSYEVVDIKVHKLDEEWGRWLHVKDLGDDVLFILGKDCNFSLSAQDYYGCQGNCIYFHSEGRVRCFSLENSRFMIPKFFWPCPTLFDPKFNLKTMMPAALDFFPISSFESVEKGWTWVDMMLMANEKTRKLQIVNNNCWKIRSDRKD